MKYYYDVEQLTDEWHELKAGKFSASSAADLFMKKTTAGYNGLINRIVCEKITGKPVESYTNEWMQRGIDLEPEALECFEKETFTKVKSVGFVEFDEWVGCSPDGLIGDNGLIQVKCPKYSTHIDYHINKLIPDAYMKQLQFEMYVTGRQYDIFYSYYPGLKPFSVKVERDEAMITEIKMYLQAAISEVQYRIKLIGGSND